MAVTPLLKPIQNKKGILYTFQSALEDIDLKVANGTNDVRYSKFALLRIPEFGTPDSLETDNKFQFLAQGESFLTEGVNTDQNINLAQSFQSYALNMETLLLSRPQYKREAERTVSERVFWKWLKEAGGVRFRDANAVEKNTDALGTDKRFVEEYNSSGTYNKVVQYIGDIDVVNSVKSPENSYTEVYIHIPTNVGSTTHVLFESIKDDNYFPNMTIANNAADPLDIEYLSGRHYNETHPFGLSVKAYYDLDDASVYSETADTFGGATTPGNWFSQTVNNAYYTDNTLGEYDVADTDWITKTIGISTIDYARTKLDGISLDFNLDNYKLASENPEIKVFAQFNDYIANKDFQYNAILIYYDTYDANNLDTDGNPISFTTNLYGIMFLDKVEQAGLEFEIPYITKYKPDPLNKVNGNAFSHKMNLKLDTSVENVLVEKSINDYSTFSLDLFTDVLTEFKRIQTRLNDKLLDIEQLTQDVESLKDALINSEDKNEFDIRMTNVEKSLIENQAIFNNTGEIVRMIENVNEKVVDITNGDANIEVSYNTDVLKPGTGIKLDKRTPNRVKVENTNQDYNISNTSITSIFDNNVIELGHFANYVRHENASNVIVLIRDLEIFIDDEKITWKKGQTLKLVIEDEIDPDIYDIKIKTDAINRTGNGVYGTTIGIVNDLDFNPAGNRPIFEIICINPDTLEFKIDKIR
jgi:hypothetical protein